MQRTYTKPADSKKCRPKTAGEVIIENLQKGGDDIVGIEVDGKNGRSKRYAVVMNALTV